jgi:membrane protease YdiL (CAAX protease family)
MVPMTSVPSFPHPGSPPLRPEVPDGTTIPHEPPKRRLPDLGLPVWAPAVGVLFVVVGYALISAIVGVAIGISGGNIDNLQDNQPLTIGLTLALDAVLIATPIIVVTWLAGRPNPAAFGLRVPEWRSALGTTVVVYISFWIVTGVVALILGQAKDQQIVNDLKAEDSLAILAGFYVMTCLVAPLAEEFFFRGFLFKVLWERSNVIVATIAAGATFGLVHKPGGDWIGVAVLALLGCALCLLFWRTASLLPCIMLHSFHNSISFGFTKELPWWGFLLLTTVSVTTTLSIAVLVSRLGRRVTSPPVPA